VSDVEDVLDRFFGAIEEGDLDAVAAMYHPGVTVWHSITGIEQDKAQSLQLLTWLRGRATMSYAVDEQLVVGRDVARRHVATFVVPGHEPMALPAAMFLTIEDGQVRRIHEFVDAAGTERLLSLLR
jgi:ketosteroid isomerase-like protein